MTTRKCHRDILQPVVALMVPRLISSGQKWQLYGLSAARQLQIVRGEGWCMRMMHAVV